MKEDAYLYLGISSWLLALSLWLLGEDFDSGSAFDMLKLMRSKPCFFTDPTASTMAGSGLPPAIQKYSSSPAVANGTVRET
jgi:hypothetical protein